MTPGTQVKHEEQTGPGPINQNSKHDRLKYQLNQQGAEMQVVEIGGERQVLREGWGGAQEHRMATEHWEHR